MWLVMWLGGMLCLGVLGGIMGALVSRSARPGVTLLSEVVSAFFVDRVKAIRSSSLWRVPSRG
ncbi:MAG: hypothetical protein ACRDH7_16340 [Actinomycetota bacterium]